jgi:hypothetical protein
MILIRLIGLVLNELNCCIVELSNEQIRQYSRT